MAESQEVWFCTMKILRVFISWGHSGFTESFQGLSPSDNCCHLERKSTKLVDWRPHFPRKCSFERPMKYVAWWLASTSESHPSICLMDGVSPYRGHHKYTFEQTKCSEFWSLHISGLMECVYSAKLLTYPLPIQFAFNSTFINIDD